MAKGRGGKSKLCLTEEVPLFHLAKHIGSNSFSLKSYQRPAGRRPPLCGILFSAKMCFLYVIATKTSIAEGLSNKIIGKEKFVLENVLQRGFLDRTQFEEAESESNEKVFSDLRKSNY